MVSIGERRIKGDVRVTVTANDPAVFGPAHRVEVEGWLGGDFDHDVDDFGAFDPTVWDR
jgi:hypothetical protein